MGIRIATAVGLAILLTALSCGGGQNGDGGATASGDQTALRDLLNKQLKYLNARDWKSLYATSAPDFRENTDLEDFKSDWLLGLAFLGSRTEKIDFKNLQVNVESDTAYIIADFYADGAA